MAYDVYQTVGVTQSGKGKDEKIKVPYFVTGADRQDTARNLIYRHVGSRIFGMMKIEDIEVTEVGPNQWEGAVSIVSKKKREFPEDESGLQSINFDTSGGSQHISHGQLVSSSVASGKRHMDYNGAINVQSTAGDVTVNGIDVAIPTLKFSEVWNLWASNITPRWIKTAARMTGTVNQVPFRGFAAGEVLFLGVSGSKNKLTAKERDEGKQDLVNVTFSFDTSQNLSSLNIGGVRVPMKRGWDVLSVVNKPTEKGGTGSLSPAVAQVDVVQVYQRSNFRQLGI